MSAHRECTQRGQAVGSQMSDVNDVADWLIEVRCRLLTSVDFHVVVVLDGDGRSFGVRCGSTDGGAR